MITRLTMKFLDFFGWAVYETLPEEKRDDFLCEFARKNKPEWWRL